MAESGGRVMCTLNPHTGKREDAAIWWALLDRDAQPTINLRDPRQVEAALKKKG